MAVDFRDPRTALQAQQPVLAPQHRLVLGVLAISAVLMCAAALWFWLQPPEWATWVRWPFCAGSGRDSGHENSKELLGSSY